ncbi:cell envelope integrity protein CreD [Luteimonas sp. SJ-92]|uniref:Cell envelope integrity protein CreD n=1 Tax=Luteimonas salinisoli TaxID=2752307 RepID=A0A853JCW1_9GAMM|nr:cell envelope integrity protein CreD [Luteimonas salinisoli]NZA26592.1 cell envelope integrity protein CreD [Luteimonas salinisoli]
MKLGWKILMVVLMTLAILAPLTMIRGVIQERQEYREQAVYRVSRGYAGPQGIAGPVLTVPYVETVEVEEKGINGAIRTVLREREGAWTYFPESLELTGTIAPSTRNVGLHEVRVYELGAQIAADFDIAIPANPEPQHPRRIGRPYLSIGIADVRGIAGTPRLRIGGRDTPLRQGLGGAGGSGLHARLPAPSAGQALALQVRLDLALGGTESLAIAPLAGRNRMVLDSSWPHPQFNGDFSPRSRALDAGGFRAEWEISSLASNAQAQYLAGAQLPGPGPGPHTSGELDAIGLSLVDPVNPYSQADRASKYGLLFVLLTFVGFFMFELIRQLRIHPIQYGLVGLALAIFFLLLVSLSEHVAFGLAYLVAAAACIGLLGYYLAHVLRSRARGAGFAAMLALLYAALYGLLISEDNALVLGAGLLFAILAAIMVVTRRVDWYQLAAAAAPQRR